jgi:two-component system nitrate/nitrite sensor histidine kinase NarX
LSPVLHGLQNLTLLHDLELRVYDKEDEKNHQEFTCHSDITCDDRGCHLCPRGMPSAPAGGSSTLKWRLADNHTQYGLLLAQLPNGRHLSHDQQQLVDTLVEQLTATLALDRHQEHLQQMMVMEERATIARELHDSIAQSLSCMKMQVSCLQMQGGSLPESSQQLLGQIRTELNTSWAQLRELLTTFRLQLTEPGLRPAGIELSGIQRALWFPGQAGLSTPCASRAFAPGDSFIADCPRSIKQFAKTFWRD